MHYAANDIRKITKYEILLKKVVLDHGKRNETNISACTGNKKKHKCRNTSHIRSTSTASSLYWLGYWLDCWGFESRLWDSSHLKNVQTGSGPNSTSYYFLGVKRAGRDVDHSPLCDARIENEWSYLPSWHGPGHLYLKLLKSYKGKIPKAAI